MTLPLKTLPIVERWDCAGCGNCCRGSVIPLNEEDLRKLHDQRWNEHSDFKGVAVTVRPSWLSSHRQLAQREDGSCVFLMADNRCRIHAEHGAEAKPLVCRMFPLQIVPREKSAFLTIRRSCPSAAADAGREVRHHRDAALRLMEHSRTLEKAHRAPTVTRRFGESWGEFERVASILERMLTDERYPLVRRLVHGVRFSLLLDENRLDRVASEKLPEVLTALEEICLETAGDVFRDRQPPTAAPAALFRQIAAEYVRLHSTFRVQASWRERWRMLKGALSIARGRGAVPRIHPDLPSVTFDELEQPLGHLDATVQQPLLRYFETHAASRQYAIASHPRWPLVDSFRALALGYPVALWLLRWIAHGRQPTPADAIELVTILERGQGHEPLAGAQQLRRVRILGTSPHLEQILAWYAR